MIAGDSIGAGGDDTRWPLVERCFAAALDTPPEEREHVLAAECADEAVRTEVRRLLARHDALTSEGEAGGFLTSLDVGHAAQLLDDGGLDEPRRIGRYEVIRPLGRGATGAVYLAHDPMLRRNVAVKLLSEALSGDRGATRRFEQEARAASALDHPRIVTPYEIGRTDDGRLFISMAYHAGTTLRERIADGPMPVADAVRIAADVGEGLAAAHVNGIVHRDIKPENILLTAHGARIVDFGIAKIAGESLTRTGAALGTIAYMSPEQTRGAEVDGRTDLWSLGVVLYEMLTGKRPFRPEGGEALTYVIRHDPPVPVERCRPEVPAAIADVLRRCLEKDPADRFASALELVAALGNETTTAVSRAAGSGRRVAIAAAGVVAIALIAFGAARWREPVRRYERTSARTVTPAAARTVSIAFVPFVTEGQADRRYVTEGMTAELMLRLVSVPGLRVADRVALRVASRGEPDVRVIGARLNVAAILRGTIRHTDDGMQVATELLRSSDGHVIWSKTYDTRASEGLVTAEAIRRDVATALGLQASDASTLLRVRATDDPVAYDLYLRGRFAYNRGTPAGLAEAAVYFREAIGRDSGFARPYVGLADVYSAPQTSNPEERLRRAKPLLAHALARDSMLAEAHRAAGWIAMWYDRDWAKAEHHLRRALALDPSDIWNYHSLAAYLAAVGRNDESLATTREAMAIDPVSSATATHVGLHLLWLRRYDESIAVLERALAVDSTWVRTELLLARAYLAVGRHDDALAHLRKKSYGYAAFDPEAVLTHVLGMAGHTMEARARIARTETLARATYVRPIDLVIAHLGVGDTSRALDWAERIPDDRGSMFFLISDPIFDSIRDVPRFRRVLERLGLAEAAQRARAAGTARARAARRR